MCYFASALIVFSNNTIANPTLDQTVEFIQGKINSQTISHYNNDESQSWHKITTVQSFEKIGNCKFTITENKAGMDNINAKTGQTYGNSIRLIEFNAKDLNPNSIRISGVDKNQIEIETTKGVDSIVTKRTFFEPNEKYFCKKNEALSIGANRCTISSKHSAITVRYIISPHENIPRLEKAFRHLITICGGKDELF